MAKFNWVPSKDEAGELIEGGLEAQYQGKLLRFITNADGSVKIYTSKSTGNEYHIASIEFEDANGKMQQTNGRVSPKSVDNMKVGETYQGVVRFSQEYPELFFSLTSGQGGFGNISKDSMGIPTVATAPLRVVELEDADDERIN